MINTQSLQRKTHSLAHWLAEAVDLHRRGLFDQAEVIYRAIIKQQPNNTDALNLLGLICHAKKNHTEALRLVQKACRLKPQDPDYRNNLGSVLKSLDRREEARAAYVHALAIQPQNADINYNLGVLCQLEGDSEQAAHYYQQAIAYKKDCLPAYQALSSLYYDRDQFAPCITACRAALAAGVREVDILINLGSALVKTDQPYEAVAVFRAAIALSPDSADLYLVLGNALYLSGHYEQSITCCRKAIELSPDNHRAFCQAGRLLKMAGHSLAAAQSYQFAVELRPDDANANLSLASILRDLDKLQAAAEYYTKALDLEPENYEALVGMGAVLEDTDQRDQAQIHFLKAIEQRPESSIAYCHLLSSCCYDCDWEGVEKYGPIVDEFTAKALACGKVPVEPPFHNLMRHVDQTLNYKVAKAHSDWLDQSLAKPREVLQAFRQQLRPHRQRLNIGYMSVNFRNHPGGHLVAGLFQLHDRERFRVFCYSFGKSDGSKYRYAIEKGCDHFVDIENLDLAAAAKRMMEDKIDILVDLLGYLKYNRMEIMALRPAPLQVRWLGLQGTTGADFYDYIITDEIVTPADQAQWYSEKFCYMPHTFHLNSSIHTESIVPASKETAGLPAASFVFGSLCTTYKITAAVFEAWMRIMAQVPDSVLWLLPPSANAVEKLARYAHKFGVDPDRLIFTSREDRQTHLNRLGCIDLGLDTPVVNGVATTSEALWCGVPVLSLQGHNLSSRTSASILQACEMPELVVHTMDDYIRAAVHIAQNSDYRQQLKHKLASKKRTAPLFDAARFVKNLENRYRQMWQRHVSGLPNAIIGGAGEE